MKNVNNQEYPIMTLREELRGLANAKANRLSRSVARLTSCDRLPCPEYGDEVRFEEALARELFYLQQCRAALERCIHSGSAVVRYHHPDGTTTVTNFRMVGPSRVRVNGLAA